MRHILLLVLLSMIVISASSASAVSVALENAFLIVTDIKLARDDIEQSGGFVIHIFPDDKVLTGKIPPNFNSSFVREIFFEGDELQESNFIHLVWQKSLASEQYISPAFDLEPIDDMIWDEEVDVSDLEYQSRRLPVGTLLPTDTSLYMIGDVSVGVITPESISGSEDWTQEELAEVHSEVMNSLTWWAELNTSAHLTFTYHFEDQVPTTHEPIEEGSIGLHYWGPDVLLELGHGDGEDGALDDSYDYVNYLRDEDGTDWGFVLFIVDSSNDEDGAFSDGRFAFAAMTNSGGGPLMVMTYDNHNYGIENMDAVMAHETGHIFGALDQYAGCECYYDAGYLNYENQNCLENCLINENSIMKYALFAFDNDLVDYYARGQLGWQDSDDNSVLDILEGGTELILTEHTPDPPEGFEVQYSGTAEISIFSSISTTYRDALIDRIEVLEYRHEFEGVYSDWLPITNTNEYFSYPDLITDFEFVAGSLLEGDYVFEVRSTNRFGEIHTDTDSVTINVVSSVEDIPSSKNIITHNQPNPFSGETSITYEILTSGPVTLQVFDIQGRAVKTLVDAHKDAGSYTAVWNRMDMTGQMVPTGIYFTRLRAGSTTHKHTMLVVN
jgi:hypothetical protein